MTKVKIFKNTSIMQYYLFLLNISLKVNLIDFHKYPNQINY